MTFLDQLYNYKFFKKNSPPQGSLVNDFVTKTFQYIQWPWKMQARHVSLGKVLN